MFLYTKKDLPRRLKPDKSFEHLTPHKDYLRQLYCTLIHTIVQWL